MQSLFSYVNLNALFYKVRNIMKLNLVKDHVKNIQSGYYGVSQLCFYDCLFNLNNDKKLLDHTNY